MCTVGITGKRAGLTNHWLLPLRLKLVVSRIALIQDLKITGLKGKRHRNAPLSSHHYVVRGKDPMVILRREFRLSPENRNIYFPRVIG